MTRRRALTVTVGWLTAAGLVLAVVGVVLLLRPAAPCPAGIDPARIRAACEQYAGLDLAGLAAICADAGYQQTVAPAPEDLERT